MTPEQIKAAMGRVYVYVDSHLQEGTSPAQEAIVFERAFHSLKALAEQAILKPKWQPIDTMPTSGEFLIGVWEGEWREPRKTFHVYEATGWHNLIGPLWSKKHSYRSEEGESFEVVGWMEKPAPPEEE